MIKLVLLFYDVGKVVILDSVFNKFGKYMEVEFEIMCLYVKVGYDMLKKSSNFIL